MIRPCIFTSFHSKAILLRFYQYFVKIETFSLVYWIEELCSKKDISYEVEVFLFSVDFLIKTNKIQTFVINLPFFCFSR